ncbi:MAG: glutamate racemase [Bacteroidota bacterium]
MNTQSESPIGIFDSGIGGLTVAHAITQLLPHESIVYFGDTAHLPYGDKSEAAIQAYSIKIADVLLEKGCKVIVIACNSASSAAYELLKEYVRREAKVINVIDPMVELVINRFAGKKIGLIGTKRTVQSGIYARKFKEANKNISLSSLPTPLLVPMIEEGFFNNKISHDILEKYLLDSVLESMDALILGCTHYPLIKNEISSFYPKSLSILDSSEVVAMALKNYLTSEGMHNKTGIAKHQFLVSDFTDSFEASTRIFFQEKVHLQKHSLWN